MLREKGIRKKYYHLLIKKIRKEKRIKVYDKKMHYLDKKMKFRKFMLLGA